MKGLFSSNLDKIINQFNNYIKIAKMEKSRKFLFILLSLIGQSQDHMVEVPASEKSKKTIRSV